jgi:hypothetical protein
METADKLLRTRTVSAQGLLEGRVDLSRYPFQLLAILSSRGMGGGERLAQLMVATEHLMNFGWDLVNVVNIGGETSYPTAIMKRRPPL